MPAMPTSRSTTNEARLMDWSKPRRIAPANRTTSPPIVVGRKLEEKSMAKVRRMDWRGEIPVPAECINTCHRPTTANREIITKMTAQTNRHQVIRPAAEAISDQPCWLIKYINNPIASKVPSQRSQADRSRLPSPLRSCSGLAGWLG